VEYDLQLKNVGKVYDNGTPAVIDFNLDVVKGEFIAFLGPSGCGKTTTLRMIAGFETITTGDMIIHGKRINDLTPEKRPTSMIFQNYALFPHMTVRENVRFGLDVKKVVLADADRKVDRILEKLSLTEVASIRPTHLSGGQRQRIALARSLVVEPEILLLDEPLGALDANLRKNIQSELKILQRDLGITFIFVTHAQSEALALSDRIVVMNEGRIEQISPPRELYSRPQSIFVARFIGANTVFSGVVKESTGGMVALDTSLGLLSGVSTGPNPVIGSTASLVLPAEAVDILPLNKVLSDQGTNALPCTINSIQLIGHILQMSVELPNGQSINIEGHTDKYSGKLMAGEAATISWKASDTTIIQH
tara:strand:+ start:19313 stop:20404 length:1092 start_codon:yes stop_codon:yes gene_type:complete